MVLRNPDNVYANSLFTAYLTERSIGIRPKVLYPPINFDLIRKYAANKEPVVAMLARFGLAKGQDFAIRAFSRAAKLCDLGDAELVLMGAAGDASSYAYVKRLAELARGLGVGSRVRLMVNPSVDEVYEVLGRSSAFIHVRPYEPFGIVVAEAMAAGAVPVVHKSGGPWIDLVRMGRFGFGFADEEEAALGICKALEAGDSMRSSIVEWARGFSYESFRGGVDKIVRSLSR